MKPRTVAGWMAALGADYQVTPERDFDACMRKALERLHTGLQREQHAWTALLASSSDEITVSEVKKALSGNVVWPE